jgi:hypothetical protein
LFADFPRLLPGWSITFTTKLAGIYPDHSGVAITSLDPQIGNLDFQWRYTQNNPVDGPFIVGNVTPSLGGGGFVEFLGFVQQVPEPSTLLLFLSGLLGLAIFLLVKHSAIFSLRHHHWAPLSRIAAG